MVEPDRNTVQEIKVGTKSKIMDMVAIRHLATGASVQQGEEKTTKFLLCEDGSLKIYMAGMETTGYWLQPDLQPAGAVCVSKPAKKKRTSKVLRSAGNLNFPQDFFEHCQQQTGDVEFSGQDILQVYNVGQVKQRLQTNGLYIANTNPVGFSMDITNSDTNTVMVAIRVLLGTQDVSRVPSSLEILGRSTHITLLRPRWVEFCFTREKSIQCQNKILVNFGDTQDPGGVNMIDSIQVWTKTKEAFGWPEDTEEYSAANVAATNQNDVEEASIQPLSLTRVDKVVVTTLETLDAALVVCDSSQVTNTHSSTALELATVFGESVKSSVGRVFGVSGGQRLLSSGASKASGMSPAWSPQPGSLVGTWSPAMSSYIPSSDCLDLGPSYSASSEQNLLFSFRKSGWTHCKGGLKGGSGGSGSDEVKTSKVKFADSEDEFDSPLEVVSNVKLVNISKDVKFANSSSDYSADEHVDGNERSQKTINSLKSVFPKRKQKQVPSLYEFKAKSKCSKSCLNRCEKFINTWSSEEISKMKSEFKGTSSLERKNKLLTHLINQKKFSCSSQLLGLLYRGHLFCKPFLSDFLGLSYHIIKIVFRDCEGGLIQYVHGNMDNIRESLATVMCVSWIKVYISIHGQNSPDEVITVLPSYMTKSELYRTYCQEVAGHKVKRSNFFKIFQSKFGPKRQDRSLPQIRISKYSSHSVCDVCLGLDNFQRTCKSETEIKYCQDLKKNHKMRYGSARVEIGRLKQLALTFPMEWITFQIDGMDNAKSMLPRFLEKGKKLAGLFRLPCKITGGIIWSSLYPEQRKNKFFINHDHFPNSSNMVVSVVFLMLSDVLADHKILPKCLHINLDNCGLKSMLYFIITFKNISLPNFSHF